MKTDLWKVLIIGFFIIALFLFPLWISFFKSKRMGQSIRQDGPQKHLTKKQTPTMGGAIAILVGIILDYCLLTLKEWRFWQSENLFLIMAILGFGIIGLVDDLLIIKRHDNAGIRPKIKFIIQCLLGIGLYGYLLMNGLTHPLNLFGWQIDMGYLYGLFFVFFILGTSNAVNITDGIDGLAGGLLLISFLCFNIIAYYQNNIFVFYLALSLSLGLLAFFLFNLHPAQIFLGNVGSYGLGTALAVIAVSLEMEVLLIIIGLVFMLETLSDIIQVLYFKKTKGKRFFKMAPYHHHLELSGYSEWQIDWLFWSISLVCGMIGIWMGVRFF